MSPHPVTHHRQLDELHCVQGSELPARTTIINDQLLTHKAQPSAIVYSVHDGYQFSLSHLRRSASPSRYSCTSCAAAPGHQVQSFANAIKPPNRLQLCELNSSLGMFSLCARSSYSHTSDSS